jgi:hypothetical protein
MTGPAAAPRITAKEDTDAEDQDEKSRHIDLK